MIKPSDVTIIVPHYGQTPEAKYAWEQCGQSLLETVPEIVTRERGLIVVSNGYDPATNGVPNQVGDIHIVAQGQCKAVNAAVATTNTPWLLVTNDDMVYAPGWFERLTVFSSEYKGLVWDVSCISPKLIEPRPGAPTFEVYFCGGAGGDFDKAKWLEFAKNYRSNDVRTGFNLPFLIKRELWDTVGGYDINYDPWSSNSDSDLEYKIRLAGIQPYQDTGCIVYHFSQTSGTFNPENRGAWERNWAYFIEKWGFPRTDQGIWEANFKIPTVAEGRKFRPEWEGKYGEVH